LEYALGHQRRAGARLEYIGSVSINANGNSLPGGSYSDTISFINANNDAGDTTRPVALTVTNVFPAIVVNGSTLVSEGCTPPMESSTRASWPQ